MIKQYSNPRNNGKERVKSVKGKFYISSDFGNGFTPWTEVSKRQLKTTLDYTSAPAEIVEELMS